MLHDVHFYSFLIGNIVVIALLYFYLYKKRKFIDYPLGMSMALLVGGVLSLATGVLLMVQFPFHYTEVTIATTIIGLLVGGLFGALVDYQAFLTGFTNGLITGMMAPMIGAVIDNVLPFLFFIEFTVIAVFFIIIFSIKHAIVEETS